ncbi:D-alanine--D-alanine ligase [Immundisolibacter sp.]|uniref:D-alanine--D-alanine ligase n=1 Tax=Immundisolibacter sp. TaxID=1934948 RepID=UPI002623F87C|nr:D-alanine--D-alanine ligase [Immundisolibacter sp.]MDD3650380.1 D-alanine--D-alanine ligase [Immundisolibacter sp.]
MRRAQDYGRVAVLYGGRSAERAVSLNSGAAALKALTASGVDAVGIDAAAPDLLAQLTAGGFDRAFIALHGRGGEDGTLQGALDWLGLPYTGSGVLGSALAMDKLRAKQIWQARGLPTAPYVLAAPDSDWNAIVAELGLPVMVKPAREGSSIGMSKVERAADLPAAVATAAAHDPQVLIERFIGGGEYTVGIVGARVLPAIKLETPRAFYDYEAKYLRDDTRYLCPCGLPAAAERALQQLALAAFQALDCAGWGRIDLLLDANGQPYLMEANTVPGLTDHSLVPMAARAVGLSFEQLMLAILDTSLHRPQGAARLLAAGERADV